MGRMKTMDKIKSRYYWPNQYVFMVCGEAGKPVSWNILLCASYDNGLPVLLHLSAYI